MDSFHLAHSTGGTDIANEPGEASNKASKKGGKGILKGDDDDDDDDERKAVEIRKEKMTL